MNVNIVLDELKNNVDEYDLKELAFKAIRKEFAKRYDIYIEDKQIDKYHIDTILNSVLALETKMLSTFGTMDIAKIYYTLYPLRYIFNAVNQTKNNTLILNRGYHMSNTDILYIVRYGISGVFDKDYAIIHSILDNHIPRINYDNPIWVLAIDKVTIKSFKNGKVIVTGFTEAQRQKIIDSFAIVDKYQNMETVRI